MDENYLEKKVKALRTKRIVVLVLCLLLIPVGVAIKFLGPQLLNKAEEKPIPLSRLLADDTLTSQEKARRKVSLDIQDITDSFAFNSETEYEYYFATDGYSIYVVSLHPTKFEEILDTLERDEVYHLEGYTSPVLPQISQYAAEFWNEGSAPEDQVSQEEMDAFFEENCVYLDTLTAPKSNTFLPNLLFGICLAAGILGSAAAARDLVIFNRSTAGLAESINSSVNRELGSSSARYYKRCKTYLTDHYLVCIQGSSSVIPLQYVTRVTTHAISPSGAEVSHQLVILMADGTQQSVVASSLALGSKKELQKLMQDIASRNPQIQSDLSI